VRPWPLLTEGGRARSFVASC